LTVDGAEVTVVDTGGSLLQALRDQLGYSSVKDGCSPQGQCGCCTVWVDGHPRVSCVTALRRVAGRQVTTLDGLDPQVRRQWADAFVAAGASQCGFCTPGIIMRLAALAVPAAAVPSAAVPAATVRNALAAHLCRCTGWQPVVEAARSVLSAGGADHAPSFGEGESGGIHPEGHHGTPAEGIPPGVFPAGPIRAGASRAGMSRIGPVRRDLQAAARRATVEGGAIQQVGVDVVLGRGGFADDTVPADALVAVPDGAGGWVVAETVAEARRRSGSVPGRRTTRPVGHPLQVPPGRWDLELQTTFVEPAYLEPDASWCIPGGEPASPLANGGAFGAKTASVAPAAARELADRYGRPVRVLLGREDVVRMGPKRPPVAAGITADGTGVIRVGRTPRSTLDGWGAALAGVAPGLRVEIVDVPGPPVSAAIRGAGWVEGAVLLAGAGIIGSGPSPAVAVVTPTGARATARIGAEGSVEVTVAAGEVLDEVVLRSYCIGAAHQALGWVWREGLAVDDDGVVHDLTIRSFGILPARDMAPVTVEVEESPGPPVPGGDAVFAAVAAAAWAGSGFATRWPTARDGR